MATITLQPVRVRTGSKDTEGRLALVDGELVAVFVRLDDPMHEEDQGRWFLEAGFGPCSREAPPLFAGLAEAEGWCRSQSSRQG